RDRHRLQRFGRGGFVRLCLRTRTPIIPCVIVGPEEAMPLLFRVEYLANLLGLPYIPITPTFPALGPLGVVPAPTKWQFVFGDPIHFEGHGPDHADDHVLVGRLTERVRATMQAMLDRTVSARRSPWFG
ncbi:MAG: acyl-phosphate glycerol 3-phosphate acyltransferase, partial [Polyangiaceae bacterium]|nr:acyl-phosphate glycerol 3-phosphate acyltransferase [Polyangiaceae bacterium]